MAQLRRMLLFAVTKKLRMILLMVTSWILVFRNTGLKITTCKTGKILTCREKNGWTSQTLRRIRGCATRRWEYSTVWQSDVGGNQRLGNPDVKTNQRRGSPMLTRPNNWVTQLREESTIGQPDVWEQSTAVQPRRWEHGEAYGILRYSPKPFLHTPYTISTH